MVTISRSVAVSVTVAAASTALVRASPLQYNPYTPINVTFPLTASHPAYGGNLSDECIEPIVPEDPNQAVAESMTIQGSMYRKLRRMEDASDSDVGKLESYFGESLELSFTTLKEQYGSASAPSTPWASSYWPTYNDGINHVWKRGEPSAAEKYATAFGLDATDFMDKVSVANGIDGHKNTPCSSNSDCASTNDGSTCAIREGESSGYCIPTWWGICHAWAPASILEQEPQCDVEKNGVTFHVLDIKALVTELYAGASLKTVFTGARYNGADSPANVDQYNRYSDASRRDLGPGYFHLAISNIMGKQRQSFVVDVTAGAEVWNQPVRSYEVNTMELVDVAKASQDYFGTSSYPFNSEMVYLAYTKTTLSWVSETYEDGPLVSTGKVDKYTESRDYEYLLELDANYNVIGGEWVGKSKQDHPDFLWFPTGKPADSLVTSIGLRYSDLQELLEMSVSCNSASAGSTTTSTEIPEASTGITLSTLVATSSESGSESSTPDATSVPTGSGGTGIYIPITPPPTESTATSEDAQQPQQDSSSTQTQAGITLSTLVATPSEGGSTVEATSNSATTEDDQQTQQNSIPPSTTPVVTPPSDKPTLPPTPPSTIPIVPPSGNPTPSPSTPNAETPFPSVPPSSGTPGYPETPSSPPDGKPTPAPTSPMVTPAPTEPSVHFVC